jgi:hypothetical protein
MVRPLLLPIFGLSFLFHRVDGQAALRLADFSCNAAYSTSCSRTNSKWLATNASNYYKSQYNNFGRELVFSAITGKKFNLETPFYPFVVDRQTARCAAHGANETFVGKTLNEIFALVGIAYADADALHHRFLQANETWVKYLWSDGGTVNSKLSYVVNMWDRYYLGVGYENMQLPVDVPCSDDYDSFCSLTNVRSLVGKAQFQLYQSESIDHFEEILFDISFTPLSRLKVVSICFYMISRVVSRLMISCATRLGKICRTL